MFSVDLRTYGRQGCGFDLEKYGNLKNLSFQLSENFRDAAPAFACMSLYICL